MNERDVRLLFDAGHWSGASVAFVAEQSAWQIYLNAIDKQEQVTLTLKTGFPRHFKTSDTAIHWCHEIGFKKVSVHLYPTTSTIVKNNSNRVLLIEDNLADIELTIRAIQSLDKNIEVISLQDGTEALDFLFAKGKYQSRGKNELPRFILLDLELPKVNGHEILKEIRSNSISAQIPVIMLSTSAEQSDVSLSYKLGSNSYIQKPIAYEEFSEAVKDISSYWLSINTCP